ncbi:ABC-2 transporter permease [Ruminococcus sp.]|uniref:ABC-2 transporter permease n=1 Tax=Ruminococcus sp. TaxID=41978 RepID=UPI0025FB8CC1|nr:ABC-2 transporter permease [Ruminococcus sp.]MBQ8965003.1 ABC-2 transporter permease [Ruminococcus sp.]
MKGLLTKDIIQIRTAYLTFFPFLIFMSVLCAIGTMKNGSIPFAILPMVSIFQAIMPLTLIMDDLKTGFDKMSVTLPNSRKDYMGSKFMLTAINALASGAFFMLVTAAAAHFSGNPVNDPISGGIMISALSLAVSAFIMPFVSKSRSASGARIAYTVSLVIYGSISGGFVSRLGMKDSIYGVHIPVKTSAAVLGVMAVLTVISYLISTALYEKKDI